MTLTAYKTFNIMHYHSGKYPKGNETGRNPGDEPMIEKECRHPKINQVNFGKIEIASKSAYKYGIEKIQKSKDKISLDMWICDICKKIYVTKEGKQRKYIPLEGTIQTWNGETLKNI